MYKIAGSIGFIKNILYHKVTSKFAQVHGNFLIKKEKTKSGKSMLLLNLNDWR